MNESEKLSNIVYSISDLSDDVFSKVKVCILDYYAAACAGYVENESLNSAFFYLLNEKGGVEESSVLFSNIKLPAESAAFLNAFYAHGAELDDGHKGAMGHPGVSVISSVLALNDVIKESDERVYLAIVSGYEVFVRVSKAAQPGMIDRSIHSSGVVGAIASACACAKLLNLDAEGIENAMALACTMSSGLLTYTESEQGIKPINPARAAEAGVFSAKAAAKGVKGPKNCLEGENGWLRFATNNPKFEELTRKNNSFAINDVYYKIYPSCRHTHSAIEAGIELSKRVNIDNIKKISIFTYQNAIKLAGNERPLIREETKFSIPYTFSCALRFGEYGLGYMDVNKYGKEVESIIKKINLIQDESLFDSKSGIRGVYVKIEELDGNEISSRVLYPKGDPENPITKKEIKDKYIDLSKGLMSEDEMEGILNKYA